MDTILFDGAFNPKQWIFTNIQGLVQSKNIREISISDVIKAFLVNMKPEKKYEFTNEDLLDFLSSDSSKDSICFGLYGTTRFFLNIQ